MENAALCTRKAWGSAQGERPLRGRQHNDVAESAGVNLDLRGQHEVRTQHRALEDGGEHLSALCALFAMLYMSVADLVYLHHAPSSGSHAGALSV